MSKERETTNSLDDVLTEIGFGVFHYCVIFILGVTALFDSMEIVFIAFIVPILKCAWHLSSLEVSLLALGMFTGMILGSCSLGKLADMYGRKSLLIVGTSSIFYFALASSISPTLVWFIILRAVVGFFVGANTSIIASYSAEIMPLKHRLTGMISIMVFWTLAPLTQTILVLSIVVNYGWRIWLIISALPLLVIIPFLIWLPESPRYLLTKEYVTEALEVINRIAVMNNKELVTNLEIPEPTEARLLDIFHFRYRLTSVLLCYLWFVFGFSYYGFIQSSTISDTPHRCLQDLSKMYNPSLESNISTDSSCCHKYYWSNSTSLLVSSLGEISMAILTLFFGKYFKRKSYMFMLVFVSMIMFILINLCLSPVYLGILLMIGRGSASCLFGLIFLYNSEVYPTSIRSFAIGFGGSFAKIGGMLAQIVFHVLLVETSFLGGTCVFFLVNFIGLICVFFLPYETKDKNLRQGINESIEK